MNINNHTVLITGGGSGIGFETAKAFVAKGSRVIITGRNETKLREAAASLGSATAIVSDVTDAGDVDRLVKQIGSEFPELSILVNNAGKAYAYRLSDQADAFGKASEEMAINYLATVRLTEKLLPLLASKKEAAVINISSIVSFAPGATLPTYSASKAALHSYSQVLRLTLEQSGSSVKVFEVMPPLVDTEFAKELKGSKIQPAEVADSTIAALETDTYEVHVAGTADLYKVFLGSPQKALHLLNGIK